jgi:hypothetical protein
MQLTDANELIKAIRSNNHYSPNSWEADFLDSIEEKIDMGFQLTILQSRKLEQIYRNCYGG